MKLRFSIFLLALSSFTWAEKLEKATFAGGCFWCMEPPFEKLAGVKSVISGFSGGKIKNPSYKQVSSGETKHREAIQITYDPKIVSYAELLKVFWKNIDPTDADGQFVDRGRQYSTAIFIHNEKQKDLAVQSKEYIKKQKLLKKTIVTPILRYRSFYPAEDYHQDFYKRTVLTKLKYKYYRNNSGRDEFIKENWEGVELKFDENHQSSKDSDLAL